MDCQVIRVNTKNQKEDEISIQVGAENSYSRFQPKSERFQAVVAGVHPKKVFMEFKVHPKGALKPGNIDLQAKVQ